MSSPAGEPPPARWALAAPVTRPALLGAMREFGVSAALAGVLAGRGTGAAALFPLRQLTPNSGVTEAARRIVQALRHEKTIRVHGDYDADGVSATALLVLGLRALGADIHGFIPQRLKEGYGVHASRVAEHADACDLLITVDCGVSNVQEVRSLLDAGVEVIVTDHHTPGPDFPDCLVVHPQLTTDYDPAVHNLTGAGVAYHLLWAVRQELGEPEPLEYAPLATLGTVADVAPLLGENRALVLAGLMAFPDTALPGLKALMGGKTATGVRDVSHVLAPRINAAGRLGEADLALELLTTASERRAAELAQHLETRNGERRALQDRMYREALELVDPQAPAIVLTRPDWHPGVMGIVASKLLERYYRPVYIVAAGKGSVRSTPGISALDGLRASADLLERFGGHPAAAGFTLRDGQFGALRTRLGAYAAGFPRPRPRLALDAGLPPAAISPLLAGELATLEPFGEGFPAPLWHLDGELSGQRIVGQRGSTLQFGLHGLRGVMFGADGVRAGPQDLAAGLREDSYRGQARLELATEALRARAPLGLDGPGLEGSDLDGAGLDGLLGTPGELPRLEPREAMQRLRAGAGACAGGAVWDYLSGNIPGLTRLEPGQPLSGELLLYTLPPEDDLRRWLEAARAGRGRLAFAWGPKTLEALEADYPGRGGPEAQADAYRRWQWAHLYRHLDDPGWARAVAAMLGVERTQLAGVAD